MQKHTQSAAPATKRVHAQLHIRLSGAALDAIKAAAAEHGEDVTAFVLRACREQAARDRLRAKLDRDRRAADGLVEEWRVCAEGGLAARPESLEMAKVMEG